MTLRRHLRIIFFFTKSDKAVFLELDIIDTLSWINVVVDACCPVHCGMFSSNPAPDLYSLNAISTPHPHPPSPDDQKYLQTAKYSLEDKIALGEDPWDMGYEGIL